MQMKSNYSTKKLFSFGIITDTHLRSPEGDTSSPFPVNALANDRACVAWDILTNESLEFIVHLGDMVHPLPHMPAYLPATKAARALFHSENVPIHFVPGNHDIGDKPMPGSPAAVVSGSSIEAYEKAFGDDHYCFDHQDCTFIIVNSSLWNSGLPQESEQLRWLKQTLKSSNKRMFLFSHYPHFVNNTAEDENYDNVAEPARSQLLQLIKTHEVEAVFSGHVHNFFYNCTPGSKHYVLPATSFVRQDYAELFRAPPEHEYGRDDTGKYLVTVVDVWQNNHQIKMIPAGNERSDSSSEANLNQSINTQVYEVPIQVHLRHPWHESIDLPYNGPMEEFSRKRARNDYTLLRLWQIGLRNVRIPIADVIDESIAARVDDYNRAGIRFHAFGTTAQFDKLSKLNRQTHDLLQSLELIVNEGEPLNEINVPASLQHKPVYIGQATTGRNSESDSGLYFHSVSSGFHWPLTNVTEQHAHTLTNDGSIKGLVFQLPWESNSNTLIDINTWCENHDMTGIVNLRLAKQNPAASNFDDDAIKVRIIDALELDRSLHAIQLQLDTFIDIDRGYSPRHGLVDRHLNLRSSAELLIQWSKEQHS